MLDEVIDRILAEEEATNALEILLAESNCDEFVNKQDDENLQEAIPEHQELLSDLIGNMQSTYGFDFMWTISGINCSAHTLQLGVHDSINDMPKAHRNVIKPCNSVAKHLRLKSTINELSAEQIKYCLPRLDIVTRWSSSFLMVSA